MCIEKPRQKILKTRLRLYKPIFIPIFQRENFHESEIRKYTTKGQSLLIHQFYQNVSGELLLDSPKKHFSSP